MTQKAFSLTAGTIFGLIALGHLLRIIFDLAWSVEGRAVPMGASWVALGVAGFLAYQGLRLGTRAQQ